jgi:protoporphyrinogen oxidase
VTALPGASRATRDVPPLSADAVVIGAGPTGLAVAWRAAAAGRSIVLVEAADQVGGMAGSLDVGGMRVDLGSHRMHPSIDPGILRELYRLLGTDLQTRSRHGRLRLADRWVAFPLEAGDLVRQLPPRFAAGAALDAVTGVVRRPRRDTFAEEVRAGLGPTVASWFYEPYVRKLWGVDPDELAGELARRRVAARSPGALLRKVRRRRAGAGRTFLYPRRGYGQVSEVLADAAVGAGADVRLSCPVAAIELGSPELGLSHRVHVADGPAIEAPVVFSSVPVARLAGLVEPAAPRAVRDAASALRHRAMVLVYLVVPRSRFTEFDAHYLPSLDNPVSRLSEPKNYRDSRDDPDDVTVLCAEVPCWEDDATWSADPHTLGEMVREALVRDGLPDPTPVDVAVRRLAHVYPDYRVGFAEHLATVEHWLAAEPGLVTLGRQGLFVGDNTHHVLAMAWAAAAALGPGGDFDGDAWRAARESFRTHVVED